MHRKYRQRPLVKPRHRDRAGANVCARLAHPRARHPAPHRRISAYQKTVFCLFTLRYYSLTTSIDDIKFKRLDDRILEHLRSFGTDEIAVKNSDIAEHLRTLQNIINRVLQDLKDKNLIKLGRGKIILIK